MSNRKATFAKRQREADLKERARAKAARIAERRATPRTEKGPAIDWAQPDLPASDTPDAPLPEPTPSASTDSAD